jgi:hypothetical protein
MRPSLCSSGRDAPNRKYFSWSEIFGIFLVLQHTSSAGGGYHLPFAPVIAICPLLILALVHEQQPLFDGRPL